MDRTGKSLEGVLFHFTASLGKVQVTIYDTIKVQHVVSAIMHEFGTSLFMFRMMFICWSGDHVWIKMSWQWCNIVMAM